VSQGEKGGRAEALVAWLLGCIDQALSPVEAQQTLLAEDVEWLRRVWACLDVQTGTCSERQQRFDQLEVELRHSPSLRRLHIAKTMAGFKAGLFLEVPGLPAPIDNLDLERAFRLPRRSQRQIHGHAHTGLRVVREGPTLLLVLDAHRRQKKPFTVDELQPFLGAPPPRSQVEAVRRHQLARQARSRKQRPKLLASLVQQYATPLARERLPEATTAAVASAEPRDQSLLPHGSPACNTTFD
jgi:hypothetical protein